MMIGYLYGEPGGAQAPARAPWPPATRLSPTALQDREIAKLDTPTSGAVSSGR